MKRICILLVLLMLVVGGSAEAGALSTEATVSIGFNAIDAGTFIDLMNDNQILLGATMPIIGIKKIVNINLGVLSDLNSKPIFAGCLDVDVKNVVDLIGWDFWLLDPLKIGVFRGNDIITENGKMKLGNVYGGIYGNITVPLPEWLQ